MKSAIALAATENVHLVATMYLRHQNSDRCPEKYPYNFCMAPNPTGWYKEAQSPVGRYSFLKVRAGSALAALRDS